ncbi:uncharacterized protein LOC134248154 [Saccostrea cucullata]|uniref:uncharacterized protein LOC134248154 n=1 Tax=Saccostrea cuccullata TaxID=36930 RepID=UPI002ED5B9DB
MTDIVKQIKEEIKKEMEETESYISRFSIGEAKIDENLSKLKENFEKLEREGENLRKIWHEEVDNIFNTLTSTIRTMKNKRLGALKSHQSLLQDSGPKLAHIMTENKKILKSNKVIDVTSYKSKLKEFTNIPTDVNTRTPALNSNILMGSELSIELAEYKATLKQTSISSLKDEVSFLSVRKLLEKAKVIANIPSGIKPLYSVSCVGTDEAWLRCEGRTLRRIDIHGSVKDEVITECVGCPADISVTRRGNCFTVITLAEL